jgi:tRNA wybutosine-synthesizing protein 1
VSACCSSPAIHTYQIRPGWIGLWHQYRTFIVVACAAVVLGGQLYARLSEDSSPRSSTATSRSNDVSTKSLPSTASIEKSKATGPKRIKGKLVKQPGEQEAIDTTAPVKVLVFFSSITTKTETIAKEYLQKLSTAQSILAKETGCEFLEPELCDLTEVEFEDHFVSTPKTDDPIRHFYLFLLPSYNIDSINDTFLQHLQETHYDFRIDTSSLSGLLGYSVFGFGDTEGWPTEAEGFCFQAKELDKWMAKLTGRKRAYPVGMGDMKGDFATRFDEWAKGVHEVLGHAARTGNLGEGAPGSGAAVESDDEDIEEDDGEVIFEDEEAQSPAPAKKTQDLGDVEDLGKLIRSGADEVRTTDRKAPLAVDFTNYGSKTKQPKRKQLPAAPKEMVAKDSPTYAALTKQGYAIVGSHSGVKICRWTKSALRGRGSCYKYSLYGINSHR